jgi:uncharacterized OB-fold protein
VRLLPDVDDPGSAPFWAGLRRHAVTVQACDDCGKLRYPPLPRCPECTSESTRWRDVPGTGTVWSFAVYHRALHAAFADDVPYTVAVVELDAGPRVTAGVSPGSPPVSVGVRVVADFPEVSDTVTLLTWRAV